MIRGVFVVVFLLLAVAIDSSSAAATRDHASQSQIGDPGAQDLFSLALATSPDRARGEELYRLNCVRCHRARGSGTGERQFPQLAGQTEEYLLNQMARIVARDRYAPKMHEVLTSAGLS